MISKKIKSRYSNKMVSPKGYSTLKIEGDGAPKQITQEEFENGDRGYLLVPYIMKEHTDESLSDYKKFMSEYHKQHECCPKCGNIPHSTTLVGYVLHSDRREDYKDLNKCMCLVCGDHHTAHERVPKQLNSDD